MYSNSVVFSIDWNSYEIHLKSFNNLSVTKITHPKSEDFLFSLQILRIGNLYIQPVSLYAPPYQLALTYHNPALYLALKKKKEISMFI